MAAGHKESKIAKKEKVCHPQSRKAGQLERKHLRTTKLYEASLKKSKKTSSAVDRYSFFFHALPPDAETLTLLQLHEIVQNVWLPRHDREIEQEKATRRKGRPPSVKEVRLNQMKEFEVEEYRTGLEVPDLTSPANVILIRRWQQDDAAFLQILRYIRISFEWPERIIVSRPGRHETLLQDDQMETQTATNASEIDHPQPESLRFSSTIQGMDDFP